MSGILMLFRERMPNSLGRVRRSCPDRSGPNLPFPSTKPQTPALARPLA